MRRVNTRAISRIEVQRVIGFRKSTGAPGVLTWRAHCTIYDMNTNMAFRTKAVITRKNHAEFLSRANAPNDSLAVSLMFPDSYIA